MAKGSLRDCRHKFLGLLNVVYLEEATAWASAQTASPFFDGRLYSSAAAASRPPAFVFDIDGVLVRGRTVLKAAERALQSLYSSNGQRPKYPICFLTNGGGVLEAKKAEQLSSWLGVNVAPSQVVLSHTPFKQFVPRLSKEPVLVAGRHPDIREVARSYGFTKVVTTSQLAAAHPTAVPFAASGIRAQSKDQEHTSYGTEAAPIRAILVFSDPSNWYLDLQLMTDIITSGGVVGRRSPLPGSRPVEVVFSNPDKVFANDHPTPRFGQGALAVALQAVLREVADYPNPKWRVLGKPNPDPFRLASAILAEQAEQLGLVPQPDGKLPFSSIYMIGDNPEADIAGARNAGSPWTSILVRTGVFSGPEANSARHPADIVVDDVEQAVLAGLHRSRSQKWHSMR